MHSSSAVEHATVVVEWRRVQTRIEALMLRLVAAADKAAVAQQSGMTGTDAWLARHTRTSRAEAAEQVRLAAALDHGHAAAGAAALTGVRSVRPMPPSSSAQPASSRPVDPGAGGEC
ncbi:MAG: hypothetical protein M3Z50_05190 [Actinomycetota bacterium]|nr:hypothetical protein [Actinomycetota bacterium]